MLSVILGLLTILLIYRLYLKQTQGLKYTLAGMLLLLLNPYVTGLSIHVFTDVLQLLLITLSVMALLDSRPVLLSVSLALALLTRQYTLCFAAALAVWVIAVFGFGNGQGRRLLTGIAAGVVPLLVMFVVWKGLAPPGGLAVWMVDDGSFYRIGYLYTYVMFLALYSLPLLPVAWRMILDRRNALPALVLSIGAIFLPVRPSLATLVQTEWETVGLAHRLLSGLLGSGVLFSILRVILCWAGFSAVIGFLRRDLGKVRSERGVELLMTLMTAAFLVLMPLSFQVWEKYLVMVLPFFILRLLLHWKDRSIEYA